MAAGDLLISYVRRKRFEARLIAAEVGRLFGGKEKKADRVSSDELLRMMGVE